MSTRYLFSYFKGNGEDGLHLAYSGDGLDWKPLNNDKSLLKPGVGQARLMRDPCIILGPDGMFHMTWTIGWWEKGIGYANSKDLVHWSSQKYIPVMEHEPEAKNCWAPEIFYDRTQKQYVIFWATTIPGRFVETENLGHHNHRMYYVTTKDFETFSETKLFYDDGFNVIDATIVEEKDGYVMFLKDETAKPSAKNIRMATAKKSEGPYSSASEPISGDYWAEGPSAIKIRDTWFVYFDKYREHSYGAVTSRGLKNWEDISQELSFPKGASHGTVFRAGEQILENLLELEQARKAPKPPTHNL